MVSRAPAESYLDRHSGHADNYNYNNYNHRMRDERSWGVSRSEHSRNRYYQPTLRRERTPSPPREYIYGVRRQREWQSAYPEEEEPDYDIQPYPEEEEEYHYEQDRRANEYYQEQEEERRRRYEQERRWQEQEEEDRRRWEAEERYRRWEEEELRRYQEENRQRKEQQRRAQEQAQKRKQQEELAQQQQLLLQAQANKNKSKKSELLRPAPIPKPPPPHPGFEATHNPSLWALTKKAQSLLATAGDDDKTLKSGSHHSSRHNNSSHHSSSVRISHHNSIPKDSWSPPYPYYTSEHSERKPLHKCKTIPSDDSYYYERKEPPVYPSGAPSLKRDTSSHSGQVGAFSEKSYHSPKSSVQLRTAAAIKKDSASTISSKSQSVSPNKKKSSMLVEIQPGFCLPLRGSQDTLAAVAMGKVLPTPCLSCGCWIVVRDDCDFVICPDCRVVSPVEGGYGTMQYVGLGMSQSVHDATLARMCTSARF